MRNGLIRVASFLLSKQKQEEQAVKNDGLYKGKDQIFPRAMFLLGRNYRVLLTGTSTALLCQEWTNYMVTETFWEIPDDQSVVLTEERWNKVKKQNKINSLSNYNSSTEYNNSCSIRVEWEKVPQRERGMQRDWSRADSLRPKRAATASEYINTVSALLSPLKPACSMEAFVESRFAARPETADTTCLDPLPLHSHLLLPLAVLTSLLLLQIYSVRRLRVHLTFRDSSSDPSATQRRTTRPFRGSLIGCTMATAAAAAAITHRQSYLDVLTSGLLIQIIIQNQSCLNRLSVVWLAGLWGAALML